MSKVGNEAIKRDISNSYLQTIYLLGFYEKLGYKIFGVIEDSLIGFNMYYLKKRLI